MSEGPEDYVLVLIVLTTKYSDPVALSNIDFMIPQPLGVSLTFCHSFPLDSVFHDS